MRWISWSMRICKERKMPRPKRGVDRSAELQKNQAAVGNANPTGASLLATLPSRDPARYAIERAPGPRLACFRRNPPLPWRNSITYFTRAMGSARSGDLDMRAERILSN